MAEKEQVICARGRGHRHRPMAVKVAPTDDGGLPRRGLLSRLFFLHMNPLVELAYQRQTQLESVQQEDLLPLPQELHARRCGSLLSTLWEAEKAVNPNASLFNVVLFKFLVSDLRKAALLHLLLQLSSLGPVLVMGPLLRYLGTVYAGDETSAGMGVLLASILVLSVLIKAMFHAQERALLVKMGSKAQAGLQALIYQKSLVLVSAVRHERTTGEAVNLISADARRLQDALIQVNLLWSGLIMPVVQIVLMYMQLGHVVWVTVISALPIVPIFGFLLAGSAKHTKLAASKSDMRVKLLNEMMQVVCVCACVCIRLLSE